MIHYVSTMEDSVLLDVLQIDLAGQSILFKLWRNDKRIFKNIYLLLERWSDRMEDKQRENIFCPLIHSPIGYNG